MELLDSKENLMQLLTPEKGGSKSDGWIDKDTTAQSYLVSFPSDLSCKGCTVRPKLYTVISTLNTRASQLDQLILISESALLFRGHVFESGSSRIIVSLKRFPISISSTLK